MEPASGALHQALRCVSSAHQVAAGSSGLWQDLQALLSTHAPLVNPFVLLDEDLQLVICQSLDVFHLQIFTEAFSGNDTIVSTASQQACVREGISSPQQLDEFDGNWLRAYHILCHLPTAVEIPFEDVDVVSGSPVVEIFVGGEQQQAAFAQNPPARGDSWNVNIPCLHSGQYQMVLTGGSNPHHGILEVSWWFGAVDGECHGSAEIDWFSDHDVFPVEKRIPVTLPTSASLNIQARVQNKCEQSGGYWMCLNRLHLVPESITANVQQSVVGKRVCLLKGSAEGASGTVRVVLGDKGAQWFGLELDEPLGKNSGETASGVRYFDCQDFHGIYVKRDTVQILYK